MDSSKEIELILVDHLQVEQSNLFRDCPVLEIVDHRPLPNDFKQPDSCTYFNVHVVGSCSTLITELLFEGLHLSEIPKDLCHLLYGALLIDNDGFSDFAIEIKKATKRDLSAREKLVSHGGEALLNQGGRSIDVYGKIKMAKFNVSDNRKARKREMEIVICFALHLILIQDVKMMSTFVPERLLLKSFSSTPFHGSDDLAFIIPP
ncbi:hypothetical protein Aperf_G00000062940 [Anoplocephala perfoliata]